MNSSGKGRFYRHLASSAFASALKSNKMKKLLESPETAFIPENLPSVVIFQDLTSKQVRDVVVAHKIPVTEESELESLSHLFKMAKFCFANGLLNELGNLKLRICSDKNTRPVMELTQHVSRIITLKKRNQLLGRRLKKVIDSYRRLASQLEEGSSVSDTDIYDYNVDPDMNASTENNAEGLESAISDRYVVSHKD